ncbi:MAG: Panacea domain-containing protein [Asticcacaulis sp.]
MSENFQLNREKLKEAVWLITSYCPTDELGNVKLHKILYFSDMLYFLREGQPITGEEYLKQQFGPTSRHLTAIVSALKTEGKLDVTETEFYGLYKKNYIPKAPFKQSLLSNSEVELIKLVSDFARGVNAKEISELSHNSAWEAADMGERIPYFTALQFAPVEITESDILWGIDSAKQHANTSPF